MTTPAVPPHWLFADAGKRRAAWRYWVRDGFVGGGHLVLHHALRLMPIDACSAVGAGAIRFARQLYPRSEARARRLWVAANPTQAARANTDRANTDRAMRTLWRNVGRTMAEYSVLDRLWAAGRITVTGREHLDAARAAGRPILFAGLHLGNWEVIGAALVAIGYPGSGFYEPQDNRFHDRIAKAVRLRYGAKVVFPKHSAARTAYRLLLDGSEIFVIYVDEIFRGRVSAPALGRPLRSEGNIAHVARLARLTGAAVIPVYCLRVGDRARFEISFLPALDLPRSADKNADLAAHVAAINAAIEPVVKRHVDQWYYALDFEPG